MTRGKDSAFPEITTDLERDNPMASGDTYSYGGMTKREYFAAMAMQGLCANSNIREDVMIGALSVRLADALIEALNKKV